MKKKSRTKSKFRDATEKDIENYEIENPEYDPKYDTPDEKFYEDVEDYMDNTGGIYFDGFPGCCGMAVVSQLADTETPKLQAAILLHTFKKMDVGMILISDNLKNDDHWAKTKRVAKQSIVAINPKHDSKIAHWTITRDMLPKIFGKVKIK